ncbi:MAG TPA: hypothetical protein VFJ65_12155 [Solirubrobacterales bacterium]|nr:hypothetical protein [Solirubrobacterales bacterium]
MKYVKTLGLVAAVTAALLALMGSGSASATVLTGGGGGVLSTGTAIHAENEGTVILTTSFLNIECTGSTVSGKTTNESGTAVEGKVESLTWSGCNCEVKTLAGGTLAIAVSGSGPNGSVSSSGAEVTAQCSTIFGAVHCIYKTSTTSLGTLTGSSTTGSTATMDIEGKNIPRLSTSALCAEKASWDAKYKIDNPDTLNVATEGGEEGASLNLTPDSEKWTAWYSREFVIKNVGFSSFEITAWYYGTQYEVTDPNGCLGKTLNILGSCAIYVTGKPTYSHSTLKVEGSRKGKVVASDTSSLN